MVIAFILGLILLFPSIIFGWGYLALFVSELVRELRKPTEEEIKQEIFDGMESALKKVGDEINQQRENK